MRVSILAFVCVHGCVREGVCVNPSVRANILGLRGKTLVQDRVMFYFGLWATSPLILLKLSY